MGQHDHGDPAWPVRIDGADGVPRGSGVLLDDRHVLTCAHVVANAGAAPGGTEGHVWVTSLACRPEWRRTARVAPQSWVHTGSTLRRDVALLRLDEPTDCGIRTVLRRAPVSGGGVRAHGFATDDFKAIPVDADLGGSGGLEAEWGLLIPAAANAPWIKEGYSGAGVVAKDGEFTGRVIGIVLADYADTGVRAAWLLPTEAIEHHLRAWITDFVDGDLANRMGTPAAAQHGEVLDDSLRLALTRELTRLLDGTWSGTVVVRTGGTTGAGASWLARLVGTADPAARAVAPDGAFSMAPRDTVLGLGAIDAAYDARGRSVAAVRAYLAGRFGLADGDDWEVRRQLLKRRPPASLVVDGVDRADDPDALVRDLLGPLAESAGMRGVRLVLGFEDRPPAELVHDVLLDPEPLTGTAAHPVTAAEAEAAVRRLADEESEVMRLQRELGAKFRHAPRLPPNAAPRLRVRLAVARDTGGPELAAVHAEAGTAGAAAKHFATAMGQLVATHEDLISTLDLYRARAARYFPDEDRRLGRPYDRASDALHTAPISLTTARRLVTRYMDEVNRRIDEAGSRNDEG